MSTNSRKYHLKTNHLNYFLKQDHQKSNISHQKISFSLPKKSLLITKKTTTTKTCLSFSLFLHFVHLRWLSFLGNDQLLGLPINGVRNRRRCRASEAFTLAVSTVCRALALPAARWALAPRGQVTWWWKKL